MPPQGQGGSLAVQGRLCWLWGASPAELHISQMRKLTFQNLKPGPDLTTSMLYQNSSVGQQHEGLQDTHGKCGRPGGRGGPVAKPHLGSPASCAGVPRFKFGLCFAFQLTAGAHPGRQK